MGTTFEVSTKNYDDDKLRVKMALSHIETLCGCPNGYLLSEPYSKFGWTFFKIAIKGEFEDAIQNKFGDMIEKYKWSNPTEKFTKFMTDYFASKGCNIRIKAIQN